MARLPAKKPFGYIFMPRPDCSPDPGQTSSGIAQQKKGSGQHATVAIGHDLPYKLIEDSVDRIITDNILRKPAMILDRHAALERIEHDQELYAEICGIFREDVPHIIANLKKALLDVDIPVATRHAHSLKSAAANIGAMDLSETAGSAEIAFQAGNLENIHTLIAEIDRKLLCVLDALK